MNFLLKPKYILLLMILPMSIYFGLCWYQFDLVWPILSDKNKSNIGNMAMNTGSIFLINIIIFTYTFIKKKNTPLVLFLFNLLSLNFWFLKTIFNEEVEHMRIPQWMQVIDWHILSISIITFINLYSFMGLVLYSIKNTEEPKLWKGFMTLIFIPMFVYVGYVWIWPIIRNTDIDEVRTIFIFSFIFLVCALFTFFLFRFLYLGLQRWKWVDKISQTFIIFLFAFVLPGFCFSIYFSDTMVSNPFGKFSKTSVILLGINAALLFITTKLPHKYHLFLFAGRSITFTVVLYYCIVFLPYMHIALLGLILLLIGLLLLAPIILTFLQSKILFDDYKYLRERYSKSKLMFVFILSLMIIPMILTLAFKRERIILDEALEYIEYPDLNKVYDIDKDALNNTLKRISTISGSRHNFSSENYPFISAYHDFIVFDNMLLSDNRIKKLKQVYFNEPNYQNVPEEFANSIINSYQVKTKFDQRKQAWVSMLELKVAVFGDRRSLFSTEFELPRGAWVSNYFLDIGKKREYGILAERKSAEWVFRQITNENRDPGIITYTNDRKLRLSVFPCNTERTTGIEFTHYNPVTIRIGNKNIQLGDSASNRVKGLETEDYKLITTQEKKSLKSVLRKPKVHFIINNNDVYNITPEYVNTAMKAFLIKNKIALSDIHTACLPVYSNQPYQWNKIPEDLLWTGNKKKGFYPIFNMRKALTEAYLNSNEYFPLIVVLNNDSRSMIMENDLSELYMCYPDHKYFYELRNDGLLNSHRLDSISFKTIDTLELIKPVEEVLAYDNGSRKTYISKKDEMEIVLKTMNDEIDHEKINPGEISSALEIQAKSMTQSLNPISLHKNWPEMLRSSFKSGFLTRNTSYISLENQAQKNILLHKQKMAMYGERESEFEEIGRTFSEPEEWISIGLILLLAIIMLMKRKKTIQKNAIT